MLVGPGVASGSRPITVVATYGMAFSGSTLFNFMLDCHPSIYGGGELHWILTARGQNIDWSLGCTECGEDCGYWTPQFIREVPERDFYHHLAERFGTSVLVDTSKDLAWFERMRAAHDPGSLRLVHVVLRKHPIRHLASFALRESEDNFRRIGRWPRVRARLTGKTLYQLSAEYWIPIIQQYYETIEHQIAGLSDGPALTVAYEDLVANPRAACAPVLDRLGLGFDAAMAQPMSHPHHQIGGNGYAVYSRTRRWTKDHRLANPLRKKHYESGSGVFIDDKFRQVFSERFIRDLTRNRIVCATSARLGYQPVP